MARQKTEAAVIEDIGGADGSPRVEALPRIEGRLTEPRVIDQRHRAADYPGSVRFKIRAVGGEHESAYVVAPAGPQAAALARAEYLRSFSIDEAQVKSVLVKPLAD